MRLIFMGTAPFACPTLRYLIASPHHVALVVTQPDRPRGRGRKPSQSAVKTLALAHDLALFQPASLRPAAGLETLRVVQPEVIVVVAYGNILPAAVLRLPRYGCINLHASLLPKYRGAAPINWTLMQGESRTGYTVIQMDEHVDTGPILASAPCIIEPDDDAISLGERLADAGASGVMEVLEGLERGTITAYPQADVGVSYAPKLTRDLGSLDWQDAATTLHNLVRALVPWPGARTLWRGAEVKVWRTTVSAVASSAPPGTVTAVTAAGVTIACGVQQLVVHELQPANRRRMTAREFAQGYRVQTGDRFE